MARNLLGAAGSLFVYDANTAAASALEEHGAAVCASPADLAKRCDLVFLCLPFAPEVRAVMFGPDGIAGAAKDNLTIVDTTTLDRLDAIDIAQEASRSQITLLGLSDFRDAVPGRRRHADGHVRGDG